MKLVANTRADVEAALDRLCTPVNAAAHDADAIVAILLADDFEAPAPKLGATPGAIRGTKRQLAGIQRQIWEADQRTDAAGILIARVLRIDELVIKARLAALTGTR